MRKGKKVKVKNKGKGKVTSKRRPGKAAGPVSIGTHTGRCHESHPVLEIGGGKFRGGACSRADSGYDIYVGLDWGMGVARQTTPVYAGGPAAIHIKYEITDRRAPKDPEDFSKLVDWLVERLAEGMSIHAGCIGGHGRTGTLLAAIMARLGEDDPIAWVREHHCDRAIETEDQINFLVEHFGAKTAKPREIPVTTKTLSGVDLLKDNWWGDKLGSNDLLNRPINWAGGSYGETYDPLSDVVKAIRTEATIW